MTVINILCMFKKIYNIISIEKAKHIPPYRFSSNYNYIFFFGNCIASGYCNLERIFIILSKIMNFFQMQDLICVFFINIGQSNLVRTSNELNHFP